MSGGPGCLLSDSPGQRTSRRSPESSLGSFGPSEQHFSYCLDAGMDEVECSAASSRQIVALADRIEGHDGHAPPVRLSLGNREILHRCRSENSLPALFQPRGRSLRKVRSLPTPLTPGRAFLGS